MGDKQYSYPETLATDLVENAKQSKELHDEVYCQILKQLTSNPFKYVLMKENSIAQKKKKKNEKA